MIHEFPTAKIVRCGAGVSFQDGGRHGLKRYGIAPAGFMDSYSAQCANRLVGNLPNDCVIECLLGGTSIEMLQDTWLAFCGGLRSGQIHTWSARFVRKGEKISVTPSPHALWGYLAIPGGWETDLRFESRSFHTRSGIGEQLNEGSILYTKKELLCMETENISSRWIPKHEQRTFEKCPAIRLYKTPHSQLFADDMLEKIISATWEISAQSDRTGYRLEGAKIDSPPSQPSMANLVGNIQITPSGTPIVTLNDGPTVGGYPVIATIHPEDRNHFVQRPPGANVHFTWYE